MTNNNSRLSNTSVNKAGLVMIAPENYSSAEREQAFNILTKWRAYHSYPINTFQATLRDRLRALDEEAIVAQRLKRTPSIINKLKRIDKMKLARMQDVGGVRAVVNSMSQVRELEKRYFQGRFRHKLVRWDDYIEDPKEDGYRSVHLVYRYNNHYAPEYSGLHVELQIRTYLQHAWATAVETMGTYLGKSLKSGQGEGKWFDFFSLVSAALSYVEDTPLPVGYEGMNRKEVYQKVAEKENEIGVLKSLRSFSIATDHITEEKGQGSYYLLKLDSKTKAVSIQPYSKQNIEKASEKYTQMEIESGEEIEAVLVSVGSIGQLKRAYPNYFLDTHTFIREINKIIRQSKKISYRTARYEDKAVLSDIEKRRGNKENDLLEYFPGAKLSSRDIPQADNIDSVRVVLDSIKRGCSTKATIARDTGYSVRHVQYKLLAAEILGSIEGIEEKRLTPVGEAWLRRVHGSEEEARFLRNIIEETDFYQIIVPDLFDIFAPNKRAITNRILSIVNVTSSTAERRASALLSWSKRIRQKTIPNT